jgi:hypothetical protein
MKNFLFKLILPVIAAGFLAACEKESFSNDLTYDKGNASIEMRSAYSFTSVLSGANEVPPNESDAHGVIILKISSDETSIDYKLIASNIDSVWGAHLHLAAEGESGPVVAGLYSGPVTGKQNGVLSQGTITAANVVGPLAGDLEALIDTLRSGYIYANVHTNAIPSGEIRGQLD